MIYAVDFDGTLCTENFPEIGKEIPGRMEALRRLKANGHKIILWTCRRNDAYGDNLTEAIEWCRARGVVFDAVNENLPEIKEKWGGDTRKVYCDYYIDDKNVSPSFLTSF